MTSVNVEFSKEEVSACPTSEVRVLLSKIAKAGTQDRLRSLDSFLVARIKLSDKEQLRGGRVCLGLRLQGIKPNRAGKGMTVIVQGSWSLRTFSPEVEHRQQARLGHTTSKTTPSDHFLHRGPGS